MQTHSPTRHTSLVTRVSQVLVLLITLALAGMVSSIIVSERVNENAAQINTAGSLRMLAVRMSVAHFSSDTALLKKELNDFQKRLDGVRSRSQRDFKSDQVLATLFTRIETRWQKIQTAAYSNAESDLFISELDSLVSYFQRETEKHVQLLRIIQYLGLFLMVAVSSTALYRSHDRLITPFKQLLLVAKEAGRGNFSPQADERASGEIGLLGISLNNMSKQLSLSHQELEKKVASKTAELEQTNRSLSILYRSAHSLSAIEQSGNLSPLLFELEKTLSAGSISLSLAGQDVVNPITSPNAHLAARHIYPIKKNGHKYGQLIWETESKLRLEPWQNKLLDAMSNLIATSHELSNRRRAITRLEIMEERAVIARELHDSLAQSLSYLKLQISLLNKQYQKGLTQEQVSPTIKEISKGTNLAYKQLREILTTFRLKLDNDSIQNSLQDAVNEFSEKCNYIIKFHYGLGENAMNPHQEIHLLQIIREALSNIHKHAQASAATVNVLTEGSQVYVEISDDGCGLPENASQEGHFGLKIMQERAKSLNGNLQITQNTPHGTLISLHFKINTNS